MHDFLIGVAVKKNQFNLKGRQDAEIIKTHFNSITAENVLKWESVHPLPKEYAFETADQFVSFGEQNQMFIVGHVLIWHEQIPAWVFEDDQGGIIDPITLLGRMKDHIQTVVGRYKGRIHGWDVVNEALNSDGTMRASPWKKILGDDYVIKAFQFAHEADPNAELYYNDHGLESEVKRAGAINLIGKLLAQGIPVKAIGLQSHNTLTWPTIAHLEETLLAFARLGLRVNISELDVDLLPIAWDYYKMVHLSPEIRASLDPYSNGLPNRVHQLQAKRYTELFQLYLKYHNVIDRVTFWGVTDRDSWLNDIPIQGRTNYPLLFDRSGQPKLAFDALLSLTLPAGQ